MEYFFSMLVEKAANCAQGAANYKSSIENLERNLKWLSAKASDVEKEIKKAELTREKKRKREVEDWLAEVHKLENEFFEMGVNVESIGIISRFWVGHGVKKLNERVVELVEQSRHFDGLVVDNETRGETLLTRKLVGEEFERNLKRIWNVLVVEKVKSIGIYGMGGVGKSTLAMHINNQLLEITQHCIFWITISQSFSIKILQDEIARLVGLDLSDEHNENKRAARLKGALSLRKNVVLILDDVWKNINLEKIGDPLSLEGCRLMITSRSLEVCRQIGCQEVIAVKPLDMNEAWNLFKETLGEETILTPLIQEIAMSVAKKCCGLPLAIITTAGSMKGETDIHTWGNELRKLEESNMEEDDNENEIFNVLKNSFDRLDQRKGEHIEYTKVQLCFLYCGLYPEDFPISKEELVNKFILEELLDKKKSWKRQIHEGHAILNKLVNTGLLETAYNVMGHDSVKMHDLVRAMALKINEGKYRTIGGHYTLKEIPNEEEYWTKDIEKMSIMENEIKEISDGMSPNCPKLSTLLLQGSHLLNFIPNSFFSQMHSLCTLDLSKSYVYKLPDSISDLENLKALILEHCRNLISVPYLGKLKALRGLNVSNTAISEVPRGLEKLANLICLKLDTRKLKTLPGGLLLNFPKLQCLHLPLQLQAPGEDIKCLKQLDEFHGRVKGICDFDRLIECQQGKGYSGFYCVIVAEDDGPEEYPPACFNRVVMRGRNLKKNKRNDVIVLPQDIQHLKFEKCEGLSRCLLDDLPRLNINPKSLETLQIDGCMGVECILKSEQFHMAKKESQYPLQMLEQIELRELPDFMGVMISQIPGAVPASPPAKFVFSSLKSLLIFNCHKVKKLGLPISQLPNLEGICVGRCEEIEEIIQVPDDDGGGEGNAARVVRLPKLKWVHLTHLPRLKAIWKATMVHSSAPPPPPPPRIVFSSLAVLRISNCKNIKQLVELPAFKLQDLDDIRVEWCEEMEHIIQVANDDGSGGGGIQARFVHLPRLRRLVLCSLPRLNSICKETMVCSSACPSPSALQFVFSSLTCVSISECSNMKKLGLPLSELQNLETLLIGGCEAMEEIIQVADDYGRRDQAAVVRLPKLKELNLRNLPRLKIICKAKLDCNSLQTISIGGCPALKILPFFFPECTSGQPCSYSTPPGLDRIILHHTEKEWWESLGWEHPTHSLLLQPFVQWESMH